MVDNALLEKRATVQLGKVIAFDEVTSKDRNPGIIGLACSLKGIIDKRHSLAKTMVDFDRFRRWQ